MVESAVYHELDRLAPGRVRAGESMGNHTSWRIGGPAELFIEPGNNTELARVIVYANNQGIPVLVIGAGSNLLVSDAGVKGIVVKLGKNMAQITCQDNEIKAEAGAKLSAVGAAAKEAGLGGFEFSAGIPGAIGGAIFMNAGAGGANIGGLVKRVLLIGPTGEVYARNGNELEFGYRESILQRKPAIVAEATFTCYPKLKSQIQAETDGYIKKRKSSQPLQYPSAGSVFKNPPGDSAGRLIEAAGLKGLRAGDAQVSALHANFIINLGRATARDVTELMARIEVEVQRRFDVVLKPEIKLIGF